MKTATILFFYDLFSMDLYFVKKKIMPHLCEFDIHCITNNSTVRHAIASIRNQCVIPYAIVMVTVCSLGENCNCRSVRFQLSPVHQQLQMDLIRLFQRF